MDTTARPADDLLEVARALLLVQGSILIATTIEAAIWGAAFTGPAGVPVLMSATAATMTLVARARLRPDRPWTRRLVYIVEAVILVTLAIDTALAVALTAALPPAVALLTRLLLPVSVILLLRRATRARSASISSSNVATTLEGAP
ncbi:MAG: hypothetical protein ACRDG6_08335 [Candidatus Limnocylindria bacterium]